MSQQSATEKEIIENKEKEQKEEEEEEEEWESCTDEEDEGEMSAKDKKNKAAGEEFLAEKASQTGVYKLPSGVLFTITEKGSGDRSPLPDTNCKIHYEGRLINGKVFDKSGSGEPAGFAPNQLIPAWTEVLQLMREGDTWEIIAPYRRAYGAMGAPPAIPGYATLCFTIQLVKISTSKNSRTKPAAENDAFFKSVFNKTYAEM